MSEKIFLGTVRDGIEGMIISGEKLYIEKHSFDCGWYWGFGYIGNKNIHTHFSELLYPDTKKSGYNVYNASELFKKGLTIRMKTGGSFEICSYRRMLWEKLPKYISAVDVKHQNPRLKLFSHTT